MLAHYKRIVIQYSCLALHLIECASKQNLQSYVHCDRDYYRNNVNCAISLLIINHSTYFTYTRSPPVG